jgi:Trypsin
VAAKRWEPACAPSREEVLKKRSLAVIAAMAILLISTTPAGAITYGQPDQNEHPYVGFMLFFDPTEPGWFSCSGTLLDASTFLTAGHCTFGIGTNGNVTAGGSGGNDVWVTFDEHVDLTLFPKRADYPNDEHGLYLARSAWLNGNAAFIRGTSFPHPDYDNFADFPANHDVGVVELSHSSGITDHGVLAPIGTLDALAGTGKDHNKVIIETAGYGIQEVKPVSQDLDARFKSTSTVVNLRSALTDGWNVHTSNNPSAANGQGGTCFGDSGGGVFLNDTNVIVAVVSFGENNNCKGADYSARTDIADSQDFILGFVGN